MRTIFVAIVITAVIGAFVDGIGRYAYAHRWIDIDVSDGHGHGPDPGWEWDGVARDHIRKRAVFSGIVCFPIAIIAVRQKKKRGEPGDGGKI